MPLHPHVVMKQQDVAINCENLAVSWQDTNSCRLTRDSYGFDAEEM